MKFTHLPKELGTRFEKLQLFIRKGDMKDIWLSKTFWFNTLTLAGLIITRIADPSLFPTHPEMIFWLSIASLVINGILRLYFTNTGIRQTQLHA